MNLMLPLLVWSPGNCEILKLWQQVLKNQCRKFCYNDNYKVRGSEDEKQALVFYRVEVINTSFVVHGDEGSGEGSTWFHPLLTQLCASKAPYDAGT